MIEVSDEEFQTLINEALDSLPKDRMQHVQNVAFLFEDEPTAEQRVKLELRHDQTLLGLYEGVPLSRRQGMTNTFPPDKIALFKWPLCATASSLGELKEQIRHTMWHELAHYFGLDHEQIHELE
jgi:predicted Zn-dependent protease with MMP-like domain